MKSTFSVFLLVCMLFIAAASVPLFAQTSGTGAIAGTVTDSTGAVIPGATVQAVNADTGQQRTVTTGADGSYKFGLLPPGPYNVKFSANGFKTTEVSRLTVAVTETPTLDQKLDLGTQAEQITVEANAEAIQTNSAALGTVLGASQVTALPLTTRNYTNILALSAGVSAGVTNASNLGKGGMDMSVNGADAAKNNMQIDGQNVQSATGSGGNGDGFGNQGSTAVPNPDSLQEFKVQTSNYDAGYGRSAGANVNVITKSGTNTVHGTAFEFLRNTALNANDFFLNLQGKAKGVLNQNQFGGSLGGPIKKDKLFFFGSYQGTRQKNGVAVQGNSSLILPPIPTGPRENRAAFQSALGAAFCPGNHTGDSRYTTVRGGVQVACDGSNINPIALNLLQAKFAGGSRQGFYAFPGSSDGTWQNANYSQPATFKEDQELLNMDYLLSEKHTLAGRAFISNSPAQVPFATPGTAKAPGFVMPYFYRNYNGLVKVTSVLTPSFVNEARLSFHREDANALGNDGGFSDHQFGIKPLSPELDYSVDGFMSAFIIGGAYTVAGAQNGNDFALNSSNSYTVADQISWTHGMHTIRGGFEAQHDRWNFNFFGLGAGNLNISTFADFLIGRAGCTPGDTTCTAANPGNTNGTLYSNIASTSSADVMTAVGNVHPFRAHYYSGFFNDDIKLSQRLTVNVGVRYEFNGMISDAHGVLSNIYPSQIYKVPVPTATSEADPTKTWAGWVVPANSKFPISAYPGMIKATNNNTLESGPSRKNFAPRFGFAWQPFGVGKFVVRGGYGMFFDRVPGYDIVFGINNGPPQANAVGKAATANYFSTLAEPFRGEPNTFNGRWVNFAGLQTSSIGQQIFTANWKTPLIQTYNLGIQYNFLPTWVLELGYVGSHGTHISSGGVQDIGSIATLASAAKPIWGVTTNTVANAILRLPYLGFSSLRTQCTCFDSRYNSMLVTVRKQLSHGVQAQIAYTWSRSFTNSGVTTDSLNLSESWGLSTSIRPQRLVVSYSWNLPGSNLKGIAGALVGGWSLSGVTTIQSGSAITITDSRGGTIYGNFQSTGRAQIAAGKTYDNLATPGDVKSRLGGATGGCGYVTGPTTSGTLNGATCGSLSALTTIPLAVAPDGTVTNGTGWGNMGVGVMRGPGQLNFDAALAKTTRVGGLREDASLQFRAEFFNLANHAQFGNPAVGLQAGTFGQISTTTVNPRLIQFALKYIF